jgi:Pyruvate/2-oxoacid:ferredoxin oxidoreductase delta subunit
MCQFCTRHGEGEKWYLRAENYSDDLLGDVERRRFVEEFFGAPEVLRRHRAKLEALDKAPAFVRWLVSWRLRKRFDRLHHGQVLPIEDVGRIFGMVNSIVRLPCICRHASVGKEARYCYGISLAPRGGKLAEILAGLDSSFLSGPDTSPFETLTAEQAMEAFRQHERDGMCHTVWTFVTPFIGGLCNCDRFDCMAMTTALGHDVPILYRSEYVAEIDGAKCVGCRRCMGQCQFGAIGYSPASGTSAVDPRRCYGCGVCRVPCKTDAIRLRDRAGVPGVANVWWS